MQIIERLEGAGCNVADLLAKRYFREKTGNWYISGIDAEGIDIARKEKLHRIELVNRITESSGVIAEYSNVLNCAAEN